MADKAWAVRDNARLHGKTKVGVAVLSAQENIFTGCNIEHVFRSHDVHAEVNALTTMIASGDENAVAVLVVAEREKFTPCGSCLDWIFELGTAQTIVAFQPYVGAEIQQFSAEQLMPHFPR